MELKPRCPPTIVSENMFAMDPQRRHLNKYCAEAAVRIPDHMICRYYCDGSAEAKFENIIAMDLQPQYLIILSENILAIAPQRRDTSPRLSYKSKAPKEAV